MKTDLHCENLILGGTAFACGMASRNPEKCLILERGILLIPEFASALHPVSFSAPRVASAGSSTRSRSSPGRLPGMNEAHLISPFAGRWESLPQTAAQRAFS